MIKIQACSFYFQEFVLLWNYLAFGFNVHLVLNFLLLWSKNVFKRKTKEILFEILASEDCYIDLPEIVQKVKLNLFSS